MADCMNKEQREYIESIEKDMLERTNMTEKEASDFAFRCWQCGYAKVKEIRNKTIDEFAERLKNKLVLRYGSATLTEQYVGMQVTDWCNEIAEQMKGEHENA